MAMPRADIALVAAPVEGLGLLVYDHARVLEPDAHGVRDGAVLAAAGADGGHAEQIPVAQSAVCHFLCHSRVLYCAASCSMMANHGIAESEGMQGNQEVTAKSAAYEGHKFCVAPMMDRRDKAGFSS